MSRYSAPIMRKIAQWYTDREAREAGKEAEARLNAARAKSRLLKYQCPTCGQLARIAGNIAVVECRSGKFSHFSEPAIMEVNFG